MKINEMFAPTIQGEGIHAGQRVGFIRLANCNLSCSWCDTPYSWDWKRFDKAVEVKEMSVDEILDEINTWDVDRIILTGGEPLMQQAELEELTSRAANFAFDVETNGTIIPSDTLAVWIDVFNVSPKLTHSGDVQSKRIKPEALAKFKELVDDGQATFKFVVQHPEDLEEVNRWVEEFDIHKQGVWIMPEGAGTIEQITTLQRIGQSVVDAGYNLTTRLHVLVWDSERGV